MISNVMSPHIQVCIHAAFVTLTQSNVKQFDIKASYSASLEKNRVRFKHLTTFDIARYIQKKDM